MWQRAIRQRKLFDEGGEAFPAPQLPQEVQREATRWLAQWLAALGKAIGGGEAGDEQDHR